MAERNITDNTGGLHLDSSPHSQPKGTYRFGLNLIDETDQGDNNYRSNEEANEVFTSFKEGYTPIGKEYMVGDNVIVFLVSNDEAVSEIGILHDNGVYETHVNDQLSTSTDKLGFKLTHQIDAEYRLRRGGERTVYWTDNNKKPKYYNFNKPEDFKNSNGTWNSSKFNLQKTYSKIPDFQKIETLDSGGNLKPGSYNVSIQYVDESLNPTEWINTSNTIKIFNDALSKEYREINGSINSEDQYVAFPKTNKAIKVTLSNLDEDFIFYRLAFIESNNGSGLINNVIYTEKIPTSKNFFIYTGDNGVEKGTTIEIAQFSDIIEKAEHIQQIDNMLILSNTQGKQANQCALQKYASKIKTDCVTKKVMLNDITDLANPKHPMHSFNGVGYMPGEIYSFGIVYIYEDNTLSPTFHIPGKSPDLNEDHKFTIGNNVFPMAKNNESQNTLYEDNESCGSGAYWGFDSQGKPLTGKKIRHHRFPLRTKINKPLVVDVLGESQTNTYYQLLIDIRGNLKTPINCPEANPNCGTDKYNSFEIRVNYKVGGEDFYFTASINPATFSDGVTGVYAISITQNSQYHSSNVFTDINIQETDVNGIYQDEYTQWSSYFTSVPVYTTTVQPFTSTVKGRSFSTEILGVKFSGVEMPSVKDTGGNKIVGYYIVRNERTEFDKTIIDSGVLIPTLKNEKYVSHGLLQPESNNKSSTIFGLIHPEHKFNGKEYTNYDRLIQQGNYNIVDKKYGLLNYDDVYNGSSFNDSQKYNNDDGNPADGSPNSLGYDGWSLNIITRDNIASYVLKNSFDFQSTDIKNRFYLDALDYKSVDENATDIYNIACDNKIGIVQLKDGKSISTGNNLPYVIMYKENIDPYSNFRVLPYYKETLNPIYFDDSESQISIFNGDSHVSSMRYVNTMFWDNRVARRAGKTNAFSTILGAFLVVLGAALALTGFGAPVGALVIGAGVSIAAAGVLFISSGIKSDNFNKAYNEEYEKGLRQTTLDRWVDAFYNYKWHTVDYGIGFNMGGNGAGIGEHGPSDDTIQWIADCVTDLWFESNVNISLRNHFYNDVTPTYMDSPGRIESGNNSPILTKEYFGINWRYSTITRYAVSSLEKHVVRKLLAFDQSRDDNKLYIGVALGEYYNINPDYIRTNKEKSYYHLALEYDCCSEFREDFPHRYHYSQQSYQEELSDNYRIFLPNNYRDLNGDTGEITNVFTIGNNLFLHTEEALWQQPRNYQERVTDQIVSFIGTGSYFEIPPVTILDDDAGESAGTQHKWSNIKTPEGVFFVSENQRSIYKFDGKALKAISSIGMDSWFEKYIPVVADNLYYSKKQKKYPFRDNVSNPFGTGFISIYDSKKKRLLFTKKDFTIPQTLLNNTDYELCAMGDNMTIFNNFNSIVEAQALLGWVYKGIENCRMVFSRTIVDLDNSTQEFKYIDGEVLNRNSLVEHNNSWTISYSLKSNKWISWHSYLPNFYMNTPGKLYTWYYGNNKIWKHNVIGKYNTFCDVKKSAIIEYVSGISVDTRVHNGLTIIAEAKKYNSDMEDFYDVNDVFFNKMIAYNSRQCTGLLNINIKDAQPNPSKYLYQQISNTDTDSIIVDRNERNWNINDLRDIRTNYQVPIFKTNIEALQADYYIDKVLNTASMNYDKKWTELENFRDKYLVVRLIFDKFADTKLLLNFSEENVIDSPR